MSKKLFILLSLTLSIQAHAVINAEQIKEAYHKSYQYEKAGNYPDAIRVLKLVYQDFEKAYTVNYRLGYLNYLDGKNRNALSYYNAAIKAVPAALSPQLGKMLIYLSMQTYDEVIKVGYQVLNTDLYSYYGNLRLTIALRLSKQYELAETINNKMLSLYPSDVSFLVEYGLLKIAEGKLTEASNTMYNVLILDPENIIANNFFNSAQ